MVLGGFRELAALGWVWVEVGDQHQKLVKVGWPGSITCTYLDGDT